MGPCLSKCIVNDIGNEFEAELDDSRSYHPQHDGTHKKMLSGHTAQASSSGAAATPFGTTALLAADEVVCLNVLGEGASGVIYKGSYRGSVVAVKKMRMVAMPTKPSSREIIETALQLEASRMGSLRHPNTVLFMGACLQGEYFCIVSEYCHLGSLYDVLRSRHHHHQDAATNSSLGRKKQHQQQQQPLQQLQQHNSNNSNHYNSNDSSKSSTSGNTTGGAYHSSDGKRHHQKPRRIKWLSRIRVAKSAAQGLLYLHSADPPLVHGMLKSTNILVDDSWNAKIADFGTRRVSEAVGFDRRRLENVDADTGLLRWASPEQLRLGEDRVLKGQFPSNNPFPQAMDVYSFGIIMWELTTGELPFAHLHSNRDIREHVVAGNRPPMGSETCSVKWAELITRCWSANPARRPTAAEIVSILEKIYDDEVQTKSQQKKKHVVNSNRVEYAYAENKKSKNSSKKSSSKFASNVRLPADE